MYVSVFVSSLCFCEGTVICAIDNIVSTFVSGNNPFGEVGGLMIASALKLNRSLQLLSMRGGYAFKITRVFTANKLRLCCLKASRS